MREASQNSTSASVASASVRTVALELSRSIPPSTFGSHQQPDRDEDHRRRDGVPDSRREIAATPSSASATMARDHCIQSPRGLETVPTSTMIRTTAGGAERSHSLAGRGDPWRLLVVGVLRLENADTPGARKPHPMWETRSFVSVRGHVLRGLATSPSLRSVLRRIGVVQHAVGRQLHVRDAAAAVTKEGISDWVARSPRQRHD